MPALVSRVCSSSTIWPVVAGTPAGRRSLWPSPARSYVHTRVVRAAAGWTRKKAVRSVEKPLSRTTVGEPVPRHSIASLYPPTSTRLTTVVDGLGFGFDLVQTRTRFRWPWTRLTTVRQRFFAAGTASVVLVTRAPATGVATVAKASSASRIRIARRSVPRAGASVNHGRRAGPACDESVTTCPASSACACS